MKKYKRFYDEYKYNIYFPTTKSTIPLKTPDNYTREVNAKPS